MKTCKIGDTVKWSGCFGQNAPMSAVVAGLELTDTPRSKYGTPVEEVTESEIKWNLVVFDLANGHWAYSEQIELY